MVKWAREMMFSCICPLSKSWNRLSWGFQAKPKKRKDMWAPCPPDFIERFLNSRMSITELFDDQLPIIMRGTWKQDLKQKSNAALSFRRSSFTDVAHLMTERTMEVQVQAQEFAMGNYDSDDNLETSALKIKKKRSQNEEGGERRRASLPTGFQARRMSAEGALPDVNADIHQPTRRASLRASDYMSGPAVPSAIADDKKSAARRSSTAAALENQRRGSIGSMSSVTKFDAHKPRRASTGGLEMTHYKSAPVAPVSVCEKCRLRQNYIPEECTFEIIEDLETNKTSFRLFMIISIF